MQIYECRRVDGMQAAWLFIAPEARLFDDRGRPAGRHGAGPHWQAEDGSRIVGTLVAKVVPRDDDDAIPWLLLHTRTTEGSGRLSGITSVQRIHTSGGTSPAETCSEATLGRVARVPYTRRLRLLRRRSVMSVVATAADPSAALNQHPARQLPAGGRRLGADRAEAAPASPSAWPRRSGATTSR